MKSSNGEPSKQPPPTSGTVLRVGLTGNIAAGKSTVSAWLAELGCYIVNADQLGHAALEPGQGTFTKVVREFGPEILTEEGSIDRPGLGRIIFVDAAARERLEAILHPDIRRRERELVAQWAKGVETGIAVTEAALLFETGSTGRYQRIVVVVAPDEERLRRLMALGLSSEEAQHRMAAQMPQREKSDLSDFVVDNGSDLQSTQLQVQRLHEALLLDLKALENGTPLPPPSI